MPSPQPVLLPEEAARIAAERAFAARDTAGDSPSPQPLLGIELEWCTVELADPTRPADFDTVCRAAAEADLPGGSRITYEPGGQIELSTAPLPRREALEVTAADAAALGDSLRRAGVGMVAIGLEPGPRRDRCLHSPRYDAMEVYFDACGEAGRTMMRSTAALQLNLDLGDPAETEPRWDLVHDLGPVLTALFANSPFRHGRPSGWKSTRSAVWHAIDPARTSPARNGAGCRDAWARYALDAGVMLVRRSDDDHVPVPPGMTFAEWIEHGHAIGWPTVDDLDYHLTTLFPPVRPRGWFELRMIDAVPAPWWRVAAAIGSALVDDPDAAARARVVTERVRDCWLDAARDGLADPEIAHAARECFAAAQAALAANTTDLATIDAVGEFAERFVDRDRCPADDLLDAYHRDGSVLPRLDNAVAETTA